MSDYTLFQEIPLARPSTPLLDQIDVPENLRQLDINQLPQLANELREFLLYSVGQTGGHFGAGLGVVELTLALHYVFNTPDDRLVWDVGHQAYPHKILTGRREKMGTIRQYDGIAAFPKRAESEFDTFGVGHSSTSISAALGMAVAAREQGLNRHVAAIIGDGAMTAGMAFEALSHAAHVDANLLVILNDNEMSISENVGGFATYLAKMLSSKAYTRMREGSKKVLSKLPMAWELARKTEEHMKGMISPSTLFEEMGFHYIGPIDGHDVHSLVNTLNNIKDLSGPQFLHVITRKGKRFAPAEADPIGYHAITKMEKEPTAKTVPPVKQKSKAKYSNIFGQWLCDMAAQDDRLTGITPAMREGSDLIRFSKEYPDRYFDVAIAEQHAVTLAAGMACDGMKPVVAIYSTFLQRGYDQLVHDVAVQNLDVLFAIDRAGLVGEDGPTHHGTLDLSFLRCVPGLVIMAPADENETRQMLYTGYQHKGPAAVRYPRGTGPGVEIQAEMTALPIGQAEKRLQGNPGTKSPKVVLMAFGSMVTPAQEVAEKNGFGLINMRFVKPLDQNAVLEAAKEYDLLVTLEENVIAGGAGSGIAELLMQNAVVKPVLHLGLPDRWVDQGSPQQLLKECGLDAPGIEASIENYLAKLTT
ncbi:1-deoxy-D-xylulose-5-phosphate synthase [Oceanospirillum linum]|uniref:1-deoxy-D-xylulose-5-phosphate synthase n=1 Tax=Oceanospirillum linum TaxID=966 RepID=A0A1T1HBN5_OCELI|nr:1-deoxy-D-xylulose-5-phosphate synthase [Oceanospirillum linum]OOV87249.1 1-deoxy-D-xylulose-5-phosphate synthase [Oceanospirillum linum]SEF79004.1 1-deoxy-D-xylulose-5-phosphate synthase [Oleiphilus messinensis]SMP18307.1 1-deoxy-D-xylulose-5-phosphate synthase [Oceanospirillum linum]